MSQYRVHFKWKGKDVQLSARSLDLTHPYFVSVKDIVFPRDKGIIINPAEDDIRKTFAEADHVMIPFQTVILIEELPEGREVKVMPFALVGNSPVRAGDSSGDAGDSSDDAGALPDDDNE